MVTRDITYLTKETFLDTVIKKKFPLPSLEWYLFSVVSNNMYLIKVVIGNALSITSTRNIFIVR